MTNRDLYRLNEQEHKDKDVSRIYKTWTESEDLDSIPEIDSKKLSEDLTSDLTEVCSMNVSEYTLFKKWLEIQGKYPTEKRNTLFDGVQRVLLDDSQSRTISRIRSKIWKPESVDDYMKLEPEMVLCNKNPEEIAQYNTLRSFISTAENNNNVGRNLYYYIIDKVTEKYLGTICMSSDYLDLTPRDNYIGWTREKKTEGKMINYTTVGSTIVPTQPLGFNYVGGKLLALLCLSDKVQKDWKEQYGDTLVSVTTTSLYGKAKAGGMSQYDNLKHWKKMGYSQGSVAYKPKKETTKRLRDWLKKYHSEKYFEWYVALKPSGQPYKRDHKNRSHQFAFSKLGIDKSIVRSEHQRGIYYSPLYTNTCEFLRGEISEDKLVKSFDTSTEYLVNLWKDKYARKRITSLINSDRVSSETLFYDDLAYLDWEDCKQKYLTQVGR